MELHELKSFQYLEQIDAVIASQVKSIYSLTFETINSISRSFGNYTMHDMNHSLRVASYMEQLAFGIGEEFDEKIKDFNALELAIMILSSILHDIGMTIRDKDRENIKSNSLYGLPKDLTYAGVYNVTKNEDEAIKEIIRRLHASRIYDFLDEDLGNGNTIRKILVIDGNYSYAENIAEICSLHGEEHISLKQIRKEISKGKYSFNPQYIAALLRISDLLDIDKQRTPMLWYNVMNINGFSKEEWEKHFIIENSIKLKPYIDGKMQIFFDGKSSNAKIHRRYLRYIDDLKIEIENTDELLNTKSTTPKYKFNICTKIEDRVETIGFTYSDLRLNLDYSSITNLLMGKNIYGDRKLGLRELIQNSIDACQLMNELNEGTSRYQQTKPDIYIIVSKKDNYVKIKDSGIGMTLEIVKKHFLNVGKSYYKSNEFLYQDCKYKPIGQYGIGFLACFLLSDNVTVRTKYCNDQEIHQIELEKNSEYVVTTSHKTPNFIGTEITLDYNKFFEAFKDYDELKEFLEKSFFTNIPITLFNEDDQTSINISNHYREVSNVLINENPTEFFIIDCSDYSKNICGKILIKHQEIQKNRASELITNRNNYIYNSEKNIIEELSEDNISVLDKQIYYLICYPNINIELYKKEVLTRKKSKQRNVLISIAKREKKLINIFIKSDDIDSFLPDRIKLLLDEESDFDSTKTIFDNSKIPFYNIFFNEFHYYNCADLVFVYNNKIEYLRSFVFDSNEFRQSEKINISQFYNKGICVKNITFYLGFSPYKFSRIYGYINNIGIPQKLDVSRNKLIEGDNEISLELNKIVYEAIAQSKNNTYEKEMLKCLYEESLE